MNALPSSEAKACDDLSHPAVLPSSAPMTRAWNHRVAGAVFERKFQRPPLPADDPGATVNDLIFHRMIDPQWSALERAFVDKETAKVEARRLCPALRVPETLLVIPMDDVRSIDDLYVRLRPFAGSHVIAKPAHASGGAVFMRDVRSSTDLHLLYHVASCDYSAVLCEMQYSQLPKKVMVETMVPTASGGLPDDYKFHCVHGRPLLYQVDHDRFGTPWSRLFGVPGGEPMHEGDGLRSPETYVGATPDRLATMASAARALAAPFEYVRVDLYDGSDGVYFGEMTFTPAASLGIAPSSAGEHHESPTHRIYSRIIMDAVAMGQQPSPAAQAVR